MRLKRIILLVITALISTFAFADRKDVERSSLKLNQILYLIDNLYVDTVNVPHLTETAINAILAELDPHSTYISAKDVAEMDSYINGNFEGIGISYRMLNDTICINQTISGCPAEKAGMLPGDRITHVDKTNIAGVKMKLSQIPKLIRGPKGSEVSLRVIRPGKANPLVFKIKRDKIPINSVDAAFYVKDNIGYIKLNSFSATTTDEVSNAIKRLKAQGNLESLILDLQSNGGGVMSAALDLVDLFIPANRLLLYTQGENSQRVDIKSTHRKKLEDVNLVVLVDEYSASASEITSGGLQDWDRATIIGRRTFGKGLVQRPIPLPDGSELRLTISRYYTPSGRNIQKSYKAGNDAYFMDIENRYKHGEFVNSDSISYPDSLKYKTLLKGRTVYGGGGIVPDIFVPLDTSSFSDYFHEIIAKGIFINTVSKYIDKHRKDLSSKYPTFEDYKKDFNVPETLIKEIISNATKDGIKYDEEGFEKSRQMMQIQAKALIAQTIYGSPYYYEIMYVENEALTRAIYFLEHNK